MHRATGTMALIFASATLTAIPVSLPAQPPGSRSTRRHSVPSRPLGSFTARWVGQDGHDYVGPNNLLQPSDVQDMHIALSGLNSAQDVVFVDVTTPSGGDQWQYNAQSFAWKAELKRDKGSQTADLFLEPGHIEAARNYHIAIRYSDGSTKETDVHGRKVSHSLRMPGAAIQARWVGQDRQDRVGPGPSVGPDGLQDLRIRLSGVSTKVTLK